MPPDAGEGRTKRPDVVARGQTRRLSADGAADVQRRAHPHTSGVSDFDALHDRRRDMQLLGFDLLELDDTELRREGTAATGGA